MDNTFNKGDNQDQKLNNNNLKDRVYVMSSTVQFCGKTIKKSKKKVTWIIKYQQKKVNLIVTLSTISGKKKIQLDDKIIFDQTSSDQKIQVKIQLKACWLMIMVNKDTQSLDIILKDQQGLTNNNQNNGNISNNISKNTLDIYENTNNNNNNNRNNYQKNSRVNSEINPQMNKNNSQNQNIKNIPSKTTITINNKSINIKKGDGFTNFKNKYSYENPSLYSKYFD